jgi:hypothetical protein
LSGFARRHEDVVTTRSGDFNGAFYVVLAFDFAEIEILVGGTITQSLPKLPQRQHVPNTGNIIKLTDGARS